jgi:hypothetical protein
MTTRRFSKARQTNIEVHALEYQFESNYKGLLLYKKRIRHEVQLIFE